MSEKKRRRYVGWFVTAALVAGLGITVWAAGWQRVQRVLGIGAVELPPQEAGDDVFAITADTIEVPASAAQTMKLEARPAKLERVAVTLQLTGRTALNMETVAHIRGQFPGRVTNIGPALGTFVHGPEDTKTPTVMCQVESTDLAQSKSDFIKAKVTLEVDQDATKRTKDLVAAKVLADKFLLDAESQEKKDTADYNAAFQKLLVFGLKESDIARIEKQKGKERMLYEILCPKSGVITEKNVVRGELADPTVNLFTIADLSDVWVYGDVYERDRRRVKEGQKMTVIVASHPNEKLYCTVAAVSPVLDSNTRSIRIRGKLANTDGRLLADMYCSIILEVEPPGNSIILPTEAILWKEKSAFVFVQVATRDGNVTYQRRPITVEPVASGIGFERVAATQPTTQPATQSTTKSATQTTTQSATPSTTQASTQPTSPENTADSDPTKSIEGRHPRDEMRVIDGIEPGEMVVVRNALGLFQEMEDHQADKKPPSPATAPAK